MNSVSEKIYPRWHLIHTGKNCHENILKLLKTFYSTFQLYFLPHQNQVLIINGSHNYHKRCKKNGTCWITVAREL